MTPPQRLKVALLSYRDDPRTGGALRVAEMLATHLPKDEVEAHLVFAYGQAGPVAGRVPVPVHFLEARSSKDLSAWRKTRKWFRQMQFDVMHFIDPVNWVFFATLGLRVKRIDHFHGCPDLSTIAPRDQCVALCRRWLNHGGIAITHGARKTVGRIGWMSPAQTHVVHNGICPEDFEKMPEKMDARKQLNLPLDARHFGAVARFSDGSGLMEIFQVLKFLPENWHAVLVGDGPLKHQLQTEARQLGFADRVHFPGLLTNVLPAYAALDAVILLARYQSFCLMLAEAMLARIPVVGLQGAGEYTESEYPLITAENAIFFPREKPWDFYSVEPDENYYKVALALQTMMLNPAATQKRVAQAHRWVVERFSAQHQGRCCARVYRRVTGLKQVVHASNDSV